MPKNLLSLYVLIGFLLLGMTNLQAQVVISWPQNGLVFQRGQDNKASVKFIVTATDGQAISSLQLLFYKYSLAGGTQGPLDPATGNAQSWTTVPVSNAGTCQVTAQVSMAGGMYKVRAKDSNGRETADFDVGVGEVFAIAGQSNASGIINPNSPAYETGNATFVRFFNEKDQSNNLQGFEENDPGKCSGCPLSTVSFQWYWGGLGNKLIQTLNVPVAFYQNGFSSTSVVEWRNSSQNRNTPFSDGRPRFLNGFPYRNLKNFLTGRARQTGLRAILWHQGENDRRDDVTTPNGSPTNSTGSFPRAMRYYDVRTNSVNTSENDGDVLNELIGQTRTDLGGDVPWVVAQASHLRSIADPLVREGQVKTIGYASHQNTNPSAAPKAYGDPFVSPYGRANIYTGPNTDQFGDSYRNPDPDKTHFNTAGQIAVAEEWNKALTNAYNGQNFFNVSAPVLSKGETTGVPTNVNCNTTTPPVVTGNFDGYLYGADCETFRGWAWDANKANTPISVQILDGANVIATLTADEFRQDLVTAGKGDGRHAFRYFIDSSLKNGVKHTLSARVTGSSFVLKSGPKVIECAGTGTPPPANNPPQPPAVSPLSARQGVAYSTTLPVFTDPDGETLTYGLSTLPGGLNFNAGSRVISGNPSVNGSFSLTYTATDPRGGTGSTTVALTIQPPVSQPPSSTTVTGDFEGFLDKVECGTMRGWVWDRTKPNTAMKVEFFANGVSIGTTDASIYRQDLKDAGKGNGAHAYSFTTPSSLKNNAIYQISAKIQNSSYVLKGAPKSLQCPSSAARLSAGVDDGKLRVTVLGNPVNETVAIEIRGAEGQFVNVQLLDLNGRILTEQQVEEAGAVEQQQLAVGRQLTGLLLLRVTSGQQAVTVKVLKEK
ncbi:putative Ig domain-containing protein [Larkinella rosea]|uniref:T9SS C-terminal target domain-containing protein n=1 Tax=Larkinella rosea TaxID=2025312 RepID=A0A3P1BAA9_9BACT|nr:putative Ig domain-containing protein [Larkinella rosea]RRA97958.1 T9SS C-terminal target domain-containing protein [Larkinella rosea]